MGYGLFISPLPGFFWQEKICVHWLRPDSSWSLKINPLPRVFLPSFVCAYLNLHLEGSLAHLFVCLTPLPIPQHEEGLNYRPTSVHRRVLLIARNPPLLPLRWPVTLEPSRKEGCISRKCGKGAKVNLRRTTQRKGKETTLKDNLRQVTQRTRRKKCPLQYWWRNSRLETTARTFRSGGSDYLNLPQ